MIAGVLAGRADKGFGHRLALFAVAHGGVQAAPQAVTQGFGHHQPLPFETLHHPMRQRRNPHPRRDHLDQQQRVIDVLQRRVDARRLQEMPPDIQPLALHRVNQQRFIAQVCRLDVRLAGQRMIRRQHQTHLEIEHRRIVQAAARQNIRRHHQIQLALLQGRLRIESHAGGEVHHHLRETLAEIVQRRRQPLNAAVAFDGDAQRGLVRLVAGLQRL